MSENTKLSTKHSALSTSARPLTWREEQRRMNAFLKRRSSFPQPLDTAVRVRRKRNAARKREKAAQRVSQWQQRHRKKRARIMRQWRRKQRALKAKKSQMETAAQASTHQPSQEKR